MCSAAVRCPWRWRRRSGEPWRGECKFHLRKGEPSAEGRLRRLPQVCSGPHLGRRQRKRRNKLNWGRDFFSPRPPPPPSWSAGEARPNEKGFSGDVSIVTPQLRGSLNRRRSPRQQQLPLAGSSCCLPASPVSVLPPYLLRVLKRFCSSSSFLPTRRRCIKLDTRNGTDTQYSRKAAQK